MRAKGAVAELIDTGLFTLASNPWMSGSLASIAKQFGFNVKSPTIMRKTPPWAKARLHLDGLSPAQLEVIRNFINAVIDAKARGEIGRGAPASIAVKRALTGRRASPELRRARPRAKTVEELRGLLSRVSSLIEQKARAPAVVAVAPAVERRLE